MGTVKEDHSGLQNLANDVFGWSKMATGEIAEMFASNFVGQAAIKLVDKTCWIIEKSSQWALPPPTHNTDTTMAASELVRPLPWVLFLPTLLYLRILREGLSFCALLLGKEPIRPSSIVRFIQNIRRNLRVVKYQGIKNMRARNEGRPIEDINANQYLVTKILIWSIEKIQTLVCFNVVKYSKNKNSSDARRNSGEPIEVVKKKNCSKKKRHSSNDKEDCNATDVLRMFVTELDNSLQTESDDSEFSFRDATVISYSSNETSITSSDEEIDMTNDNDQPEDKQNNNPHKQGTKAAKKHQHKHKTKSVDDEFKNGEIEITAQSPSDTDSDSVVEVEDSTEANTNTHVSHEHLNYNENECKPLNLKKVREKPDMPELTQEHAKNETIIEVHQTTAYNNHSDSNSPNDHQSEGNNHHQHYHHRHTTHEDKQDHLQKIEE